MKKPFLILSLFLLFVGGLRAQGVGGRIEVGAWHDGRVRPEAKAFLAPYKHSVDSLMGSRLGTSLVAMTPQKGESLLGDFLSDVLVEETGADLAVLNRGGLRASLPKGDITVGDIMKIAPFENHLVVVPMKGAALLALAESLARAGGECVSREVRLTIKDGTLGAFAVKGRKVSPEATYRVATLDYLAEGNDGMEAFALTPKAQVEQTGRLVRDVYMDYIRRKGVVGAKMDGRITADGSAPTSPVEEERSGAPVSAEPTPSTPSWEGPGAGAATLFILHTNDTHSAVEPGYLRRTVVVDSLRAVHPDLVLLDAGDFSQGSPYYNLYKGDVETGLMSFMHYDAATIGNHEFDFGLDNMARLFRRVSFPIVCCNYDFRGTALEGLVVPYTIVERGGHRIGIVGVGAPLEGLVAKANCAGVAYLDPAVEADRWARHLKEAQKCDLVVLLSHLGCVESNAVCDQKVIAATRYIDAVVGGHSHTLFERPRYQNNADGRPVIYNQEGKSAKYVGLMCLPLE